MQHVFGGDGFPTNTGFCKRHVLGDIRVEMVTDHQHVQVLVDGIHRVGQRRVGGGGQNIRVRAGGDDIRRMAAARPFGVEGVDGAPGDGSQRVFDKTGLVQRVAV